MGGEKREREYVKGYFKKKEFQIYYPNSEQVKMCAKWLSIILSLKAAKTT